MIYHCYNCNQYAFEATCPRCTNNQDEAYVPLDPKYYPEFKYQSQGLVKDVLFKRQTQQQLNEKLSNVLEKYERFKYPYFVNYLHIAQGTFGVSGDNTSLTTSDTFRLKLFQRVLTRLGFNELSEFDNLTLKLVRSTEFSFDYANFVSQIKGHIKEDLRKSLYSWIGEVGARYRKELPLFVYYLWDSQTFTDQVSFSSTQSTQNGAPLVSQPTLKAAKTTCEEIYMNILVSRFKKTLENFDPKNYINIYKIDAMDGFAFEGFLVDMFRHLGYDVEETRKSQDQGADLFVSRFGKRIVIQAKNYKDNVGNAAIQQALSAKSFFDCDEAMVITNSYFTRSATELAEKTNVRLIDRDGLQKYIDEYNQIIIETVNEAGQKTELQLDNPVSEG